MTNYSQNNEQDTILAAVAHVGAGRFLDIGAWSPTDFSNTRALYESGWSGVMVEPSPAPFITLLRAYGNDARVTLVNAAVSLERGFRKFHFTDDALSTDQAANYEKWKHAGGFYGSGLTFAITIEDLLQYGPYDFVSIDTEGTSAALFEALLRTEARPACICVEHDHRQRQICEIGGQHGYRKILETSENLVLAR